MLSVSYTRIHNPSVAESKIRKLAGLVTTTPPAKKDTSPRASGPAGPQFEAKVAVHYALALLARTEAFGLPGAIVECVEFQRGSQGYRLDDIIIKGQTRSNEERCLEIQAKRSIAFTKSDDNFSEIVQGIVAGHDVDTNRMFAVAIERTSQAIETGVQEALELARATTTAESFYRLLRMPGRGNTYMHRFVDAFGKHLSDNGITDEETLFQLLKRFVVLVFDYARPNSIAEHHDRMRSQHLASNTQSSDLYDALLGLVLRLDAIGGETDYPHMTDQLRDLGIEISSARALAKARGRIEEMSRFALSDINSEVADCQLVRSDRRQELASAIDEAEAGAGVVEITGPGGAGKSALLKTIADVRGAACRIMVLAPDRTPSGGWAALRNGFDIDATADEFFEDLSCDGGGLICIDGLDRFRDEGQRKTVLDVMRAASSVKGMTILFSARSDWQREVVVWLGNDIVDVLTGRKTVIVEGLNDEEAGALAEAAPALASLLGADHPARQLARNPFSLHRLSCSSLDTETVLSEAALARDWWMSGGHGVGLTDGAQRARRRVLVGVCEALISGNALADVSDQDSDAVASLLSDGVFVEIGATDHVRFKHDIYNDWALACFFAERPTSLESLNLNEPPTFWLSRGFELSCRILAEGDDDSAWPSCLRTLEGANAQGGWIGLALLALVRSEHADRLLSRFSPILLEEEGERAATLIRRAMATHGQGTEAVLKEVVPAGTPLPGGLMLPIGPFWLRLIVWCASRFDALPSQALAASIDLFEKWMTISIFVEDAITPILLECFADILVDRIEDGARRRPKLGEPLPKIKYPVGEDAVETARLQLALHARRAPSSVARYLKAVSDSSRAADELYRVLQFPGQMPASAPSEFALAFRSAVLNDTEAISEYGSRRRTGRIFWRLEGPFVLGRSGIAVFSQLLEADGKEGLSLIRDLVQEAEKAAQPEPEDSFELVLAETTRRISPTFSYGWSRGHGPSTLLVKALEALEHWAHQKIDSPKSLKEVVLQIAGEDLISGAILLIIVDLVLTHSATNEELLVDLLSSPELLALDALRAQRDSAERLSGGSISFRAQPTNQADEAVEKELSDCQSRGLALHDAISQVVFRQSQEANDQFRRRLAEAGERIGEWTEDSVVWSSPAFIASHALRLATKDSYEEATEVGSDGSRKRGWKFLWPQGQWRWLQTQGAQATADSESFSRALAIRMAMDSGKRPTSVSVADAEVVLQETKDASPNDNDDPSDPNDPWINRVAAGAFLARFGDSESIEAQRVELMEVFEKAVTAKESTSPNVRYDVMYDQQALAIAGLLYLAIGSETPPQIRDLFDAVQAFPASAAAVFSRHLEAARKLGDSAMHSIVRIGLQSCIFPRRPRYDEDESAFKERRQAAERNSSDRLAEELKWLDGDGQEPVWLCPPPRRPRRPRRGFRIPGGDASPTKQRSAPARPDFYFDDHTAVVWLKALSMLGDNMQAAVAPLLRDNRDWLVEVNSSVDDEDETDLERTWTRGLMKCAGRYSKLWSEANRQSLVFDLLNEFSDEAFIDAAAAFLLQSDLHHIEGDATDTAHLVDIRQRLWLRLQETRRWRQHVWSPRSGIEIHLGELVDALFFKVGHGFGAKTAYTAGLTDDQLAPFLPILTEIAVAASPCPTIALLFLDVLELVDGKLGEPFVAEAASHWAEDADVRFWNELGIGRRVCKLAKNGGNDAESVTRWIRIADAISAAGVSEGDSLMRELREKLR